MTADTRAPMPRIMTRRRYFGDRTVERASYERQHRRSGPLAPSGRMESRSVRPRVRMGCGTGIVIVSQHALRRVVTLGRIRRAGDDVSAQNPPVTPRDPAGGPRPPPTARARCDRRSGADRARSYDPCRHSARTVARLGGTSFGGTGTECDHPAGARWLRASAVRRAPRRAGPSPGGGRRRLGSGRGRARRVPTASSCGAPISSDRSIPVGTPGRSGSSSRLMREGSFDVVHTHQSKAGLLGRVAARRARVPVVYHSASMASFGPGYGRAESAAFAARRAGHRPARRPLLRGRGRSGRSAGRQRDLAASACTSCARASTCAAFTPADAGRGRRAPRCARRRSEGSAVVCYVGSLEDAQGRGHAARSAATGRGRPAGHPAGRRRRTRAGPSSSGEPRAATWASRCRCSAMSTTWPT